MVDGQPHEVRLHQPEQAPAQPGAEGQREHRPARAQVTQDEVPARAQI
nr:hypothetical protein [Tepidiforma sp.]